MFTYIMNNSANNYANLIKFKSIFKQSLPTFDRLVKIEVTFEKFLMPQNVEYFLTIPYNLRKRGF